MSDQVLTIPDERQAAAGCRGRPPAAAVAVAVAAMNLGYAASFLVVRPHNPDTAGTAASVFLTLGGLLAFGASALAVLCFWALIRRDRRLPRGLAALAAALGVLLLIVYARRLAVLSTHNPALVASAALAGFVASPAWYAWLGLTFMREAT